MKYEVPKPKKRCTSVIPFKFRTKILADKNRAKSNIFNITPNTLNNFYNNKEITKNKIKISNSILNDINKYNFQNRLSATTKLNIKDIDIIKEKHNDELIAKIYNYLEQKKDKISLLNKSKMDKLKRLLLESKSEQDILAKTFSTQFIGNEEYKNLSYAFEVGHGQRIGGILQYKGNKYDTTFRRTQSQLFKTKQGLTVKEKNMLKSIISAKKRNIDISSKINYYNDLYDAFNSLKLNRNLFNQLILKQEKEQIKQFLKKELQNEQRKFTYKLMPRVKTIELSKYKKETKEITTTPTGRKAIVNSIIDFSKIPRADLFTSFRSVFLKTINKFLSTPTCRQGATMLHYLDTEKNINKLFLFGGMNIIRLNDLWECTISLANKLEKKYIWKKVDTKGENPLPRNGHTMV